MVRAGGVATSGRGGGRSGRCVAFCGPALGRTASGNASGHCDEGPLASCARDIRREERQASSHCSGADPSGRDPPRGPASRRLTTALPGNCDAAGPPQRHDHVAPTRASRSSAPTDTGDSRGRSFASTPTPRRRSKHCGSGLPRGCASAAAGGVPNRNNLRRPSKACHRPEAPRTQVRRLLAGAGVEAPFASQEPSAFWRADGQTLGIPAIWLASASRVVQSSGPLPPSTPIVTLGATTVAGLCTRHARDALSAISLSTTPSGRERRPATCCHGKRKAAPNARRNKRLQPRESEEATPLGGPRCTHARSMRAAA